MNTSRAVTANRRTRAHADNCPKRSIIRPGVFVIRLLNIALVLVHFNFTGNSLYYHEQSRHSSCMIGCFKTFENAIFFSVLNNLCTLTLLEHDRSGNLPYKSTNQLLDRSLSLCLYYIYFKYYIISKDYYLIEN